MESGTKLGHYTISSLIGKGGMGEVYQAKDERLGRQVAIKVLPEEFARDGDRVSRLRREAQLLAALNHPNIAAIHGLEETDGKHFLVLELVEGPTLADRIQQGTIPVEEALKLALQIAEALEAAHEKGIIHRDLKPANIKVTEDGKVKVLDFGLAKAFAADQSDANLSNSPTLSMAATQQGIILGTAGYMSPEQASGSPTDKRADIWSFGVLVFEMLTGRQVFAGETVSHVLAAVLAKDPPWDTLPTNIHPRLRDLLERCLVKDPKNRRHDVSDVRIDIQKVLFDPNGVVDQPTSEAVAPGQQSARLWIAALVLVAVVSGIAAWFMKPVPSVEPGQVTRFYIPLGEGQQFSRPEWRMVALSADGDRMAYVANGQIYVRDFNQSESRPVPGTAEGNLGPGSPTFSPDGQWLSYFHFLTGNSAVVKRVPTSGGTPVRIMSLDQALPQGLSWPTAETLVLVTEEGIVRVSANGGDPEVLVAPVDGEFLRSPQMLPDGASLLFTVASEVGATGWDEARIVVQSINSQDRTTVWEGGSDGRYLQTGHIVYSQANTLFGIPFDLGTRTVTGGPVPLVEGVRRAVNTISDTANYLLSDNGTLAYIPGTGAAGNPFELTLLDRNGGVQRLNVPADFYVSPSLSPDGNTLVVQTGTGEDSYIQVYDLSGNTVIRRLTQLGEGTNRQPVWTPDGQRVTFASDRNGESALYWQVANGSAAAEPLYVVGAGNVVWPESWSPDGTILLFTQVDTQTGQRSLWTLRVGESEATRLTSTDAEASEFGASFSPDGNWLAYTENSTAGGGFAVFVQPYPPTGVRFQISERDPDETNIMPLWTVDGSELVFQRGTVAGAQDAVQLVAVNIVTEGGFNRGAERVLPLPGFHGDNPYRDYAMSPDGEHFLVALPAVASEGGEADNNQINVVLNWLEELKQRVPVR